MRQTRSEPTPRPELTPAERQRLARRYPKPRVPRPLLFAVVAVIAVGALSWLVWAALMHSQPVVAAEVTAYTVVSDTRIDVTVTVDRPNPSVPVVCRISAQAPDFQPVGEVNLAVPATSERVVDVDVSVTTLRPATTAVVRECSPA